MTFIFLHIEINILMHVSAQTLTNLFKHTNTKYWLINESLLIDLIDWLDFV